MKRKELKISPVPEDSKFYKIYAHILLLWPFAPIIMAFIFLFFIGDEACSKFFDEFMKVKEFLIFVVIAWLASTLNMFRELFNYLIVEEVCYVDKKTFFYQKFRRAFGMRKLMTNLEIPFSDISEVKEGKKPSFLYFFFSPIAHRNSVELITTDGKKYQIMNSVLFGSRNSLKPNSKVTDERTTKIYNEVKNMISK
ncbi:hypothetical protein [Fusobacterium pseudoperiodonticum]|uniref:Uncharacterized protein n=1 Tax=Fusobacterium pseudoperiodonticum TaxID=2663009 RepID=A0A2D3PVK0_9FUSO|nr:hypothetical protein [Fusobacterium pseudoperiodonticum]ATV70854.1 hypothetical protein CTM98_09475 [Fusobacterium pseudoperiodonticum]